MFSSSTVRVKSLLVSLLLAFALAFGLAAAPLAAPTMAPAAQAAGYLNIQSSYASVDTLKVCRVYTTYCVGPTGYINAGQSTKGKYGWSDTDAFYVTSSQDVKLSDGVWYRSSGWKKLSNRVYLVARVYWNQ